MVKDYVISPYERTCVTYDPATEPWVAQFDVNADVDRLPRVIDDGDLRKWASYAIDPKDQAVIPAGAYCGLFRVDLLRQKFIARFTLPETRRSSPIDASKRDEVIRILKDSETSAQNELSRYATDTNPATNPTNPYHACAEAYRADSNPTSVDSAFTRCLVGVAAFITVVQVKMILAENETLESLNSRNRATLAGCGIVFEKKDGQPAKITSLHPNAKNLDKDMVGSRIVSIDGKETTPMTKEEVRTNLRGPLETEATLVIQLANGGSKTVKIKRSLFQFFYSNESSVREEKI